MSEHTITHPNVKRLERSRDGKIVAGVSSGLGRYFDLTPAVFRLGFVVLTVLGGAGVLVYLAAILVIPKEGDERSIAEEILENRRDHPARLVALGLVAVAVLSLLARPSTWPTAGSAWFLVAVAGVIFLWTSRRRAARGVLVGVLATLALILVTATAAVVAAFAWFNVSLGDGVGHHSYTPTTLPTSRYELGVGKLELDLTKLGTTNGTVRANIGVGDLRVVVPQNVAVVLRTHVQAGSIDALGRHDDGTNARIDAGRGELELNATVGAGHIEVVRAP
jgi:phage shock protein PspC (stress-responsive transcriptional regulator)